MNASDSLLKAGIRYKVYNKRSKVVVATVVEKVEHLEDNTNNFVV
jgi:hypothetical protein